jgi:LIVCS family branched-chain amino acid:cation transporter
MPKVPYKIWLVVFTVVSFGVASLGLQTVLDIASPIIGFLYPIAITVVAATLVDVLIQKITGNESFVIYGFRLAAWVSVMFSALMVIAPSAVEWAPLSGFDLGWTLPVAVAYVIGLIIDVTASKKDATVREI